MSLSAEQRSARAKLAAERRWHGPDAELSAQAVEFELAARERHIAELVDFGVEAFKKASPEKIEQLRNLFAPLIKAARIKAHEHNCPICGTGA
jgi:hypothetical protein